MDVCVGEEDECLKVHEVDEGWERWWKLMRIWKKEQWGYKREEDGSIGKERKISYDRG